MNVNDQVYFEMSLKCYIFKNCYYLVLKTACL